MARYSTTDSVIRIDTVRPDGKTYHTEKTITSVHAAPDKLPFRRSGLFSLLAGLLILMLLLNLFMSLQHNATNRFTFERLLRIFEDIGNNEALQRWTTFRITAITSDWGYFDFIRIFINEVCIQPLNCLLFFLGGCANIMIFVGYVLDFLLIDPFTG